MEDIFKANETDRGAEIIKLGDEIIKKTEMLDKAAKKLINDELDKEDHKKVKDSIQKERAELKIRIIELKLMAKIIEPLKKMRYLGFYLITIGLLAVLK